jgi:hypothetical protein
MMESPSLRCCLRTHTTGDRPRLILDSGLRRGYECRRNVHLYLVRETINLPWYSFWIYWMGVFE